MQPAVNVELLLSDQLGDLLGELVGVGVLVVVAEKTMG